MFAHSKSVSSWQWHKVWIKASLKPSIKVFEELAEQAKKDRAYNWLFISSLVIAVRVNFILSWQQSFTHIILATIMFTFLSIILMALQNALAKIFGVKGNYNQLCFTVAAFTAPLGIAASIVTVILPKLHILLILAIYTIFLSTVMIKSVHKLSWIKSVTINLILFTAVLLQTISLLRIYDVIL
jgi:hypothetical protein